LALLILWLFLGVLYWGDCAGELVAHIKFTVLLMPNGSDRITAVPCKLAPSKQVEDPRVKAWLALGTKSKKKGGEEEERWAWHLHSAVQYSTA